MKQNRNANIAQTPVCVGVVSASTMTPDYNNQIVECEYSPDGWKPIQIRLDKNVPNSILTYHRTIQNLQVRQKVLTVYANRNSGKYHAR